MEIAARHGLPVVEDNAHGLFGKYRGKYLGTFGCLATQSFHETKNFTCGEGGALLINDPQLRRARRDPPRERAPTAAVSSAARWTSTPGWTSAPATCRRISWPPSCWRSSNRSPSSRQAAQGNLGALISMNSRIGPDTSGVRLPVVPAHCEPPYHMFSIFEPPRRASGMIEHLKKSRDPGCLPLPTPAPLEYGEKTWRRDRRLPCDRMRRGLPGALTFLQWDDGARANAGTRSSEYIPSLKSSFHLISGYNHNQQELPSNYATSRSACPKRIF